MKTRLNMRMPAQLIDWAKQHAKKKNTSVSALVRKQLESLQKKEVARATR